MEAEVFTQEAAVDYHKVAARSLKVAQVLATALALVQLSIIIAVK